MKIVVETRQLEHFNNTSMGNALLRVPSSALSAGSIQSLKHYAGQFLDNIIDYVVSPLSSNLVQTVVGDRPLVCNRVA